MADVATDEQIPADPDARPLVLFDMDGTLTDPADGIISCHRWALAEVGFEVPADVDTNAMIGPPAAQLDRAPSGVAMVGDRRHDIDAARSLQMTGIGAAWGFGSIDELIAADAHAIAMTPADVAEFLLG